MDERDLESSSEVEFTVRVVVAVDHNSQAYRNRLLAMLLPDDITPNNAMDLSAEEFGNDFVRDQLRQNPLERYGKSQIFIRGIEQKTTAIRKGPLADPRGW